MEEQGVIGAVRLSDKAEMEQPDPLILSAEEVKSITWRHFETLLKSMYMQPPESIKVKYLDDENDWVELSSDAELAEAFRYTRESGEILQLSVKASDANSLVVLDETDSSKTPEMKEKGKPYLYTYIPTTDPGGDVHQSKDANSESPQCVSNTSQSAPLLVYPQNTYRTAQGLPVIPAVRLQQAFRVPGPINTTPAQLPSERGDQQQQQPTVLMYPHSSPQGGPQASLSSQWGQAAHMSCEEKLQFLKTWVEYQHGLRSLSSSSRDSSSDNSDSHGSTAKPLCFSPTCSHQMCLGKNSVPNQDPFEVAGDGEQQENSAEILVPTQAQPPGTKSRSSSETSFTSQSSSSSSVDIPMPAVPASRPTLNVAAIIPKSSYTSAVVPKAKLPKKLSQEAGVPIPMPRNLLMLEGAQSGANAVAIEMPSEPEYYATSGLNKEEEIAASGGAASTSASEETGEIVARGGGSHAASVDRLPKSTAQADSCAVSSLPSKSNVVLKQPVKTRLSLAKKDPVAEQNQNLQGRLKTSESLGTGAKPKVIEKKTVSAESKKSLQGKKMSSEKKSATAEDAGVGDQGVITKAAWVQKAEDAALQYNDFIKHMKRLKKDLHCSVVKDVAKQTDKLLKKRLSRSLSQGAHGDFCNTKSDNGPVIHKGITCDHCDMEIVGVRYKCGNCEDFDLCETCECSEFVHDPTHVFLKLRKPARNAGVRGNVRVSLLKENIYEAETNILELKKIEKSAEKEAKKEMKKKEKDEKKEGKRKSKEKKKSEKAKKMNQNDGKKEAEKVQIRPASEMAQIMEKVEERQAYQERVQPRDWSPFEEVPLKMNSPAELEELYDMMWQEKQKLAVTDETRSVTGPRNVSIAHPVVERTHDGDHFEEEPLLPVVRDRCHSDSSGSSIVRIPHPMENPETLQAMVLQAAESNAESLAVENVDPEQKEEIVPVQNNEEPLKCDECTEVVQNQDSQQGEEGSSDSSYVCYESDSSEDFCVLDHPGHPDDYEEIQQSEDDEEEFFDECIEQPAPEEQTEPQETELTVETTEAVPSSFREDENNNDETGEADVTLEASPDVVQDACSLESEEPSLSTDLVHSMTQEEKLRFQELLKVEKLRDMEQKTKQKCEADIREHREMKLKLEQEMRKIEELEREKQNTSADPQPRRLTKRDVKMLKKKKRQQSKVTRPMTDSAEYRDILEVKTMQAVLENERLEEAALEEEARRIMEEEEEEWKKQRASDPAYYRLLVTERRVGQILELEMQKFTALNNGDSQALAEIQSKLQELDKQKKLDEKRLELVERDFFKEKSSDPSSVTSSSEGGENLSRQSSAASTQCGSEISEPSDIEPVTGGTVVTTTTGSQVVGEKKDANCQTMLPDANHQAASHLIQNMASGVSKAASTAFSTAKDVFYSLQAKQNEWKASTWKPPSNTYVPPTSKWTPPEDTYVPPKNDYVPPKDNYVPPRDIYIPPEFGYMPQQSTWIPPAGTFLPPTSTESSTDPRGDTSRVRTANTVPTSTATSVCSTDTVATSSARTQATATECANDTITPCSQATQSTATIRESSSERKSSMTTSLVPSPMSTSPFISLDIADSALRKEVMGMQRLIEMGFANREQNRQLLTKFEGDLEKVVQALLQEEGEDHWAFQRH